MVMVVPNDIEEWHRLSVLNHNAPFLDKGIVFNPEGQKEIHILPPRRVEEKLVALLSRLSGHPDLIPIYTWARNQLEGKQGDRIKKAADYWLAAAQMQVVTTHVGDLSKVIDEGFVRRLHPEVPYTILHPSKSITEPRHPEGRPLFGHELIQALLSENGRGDLAGWVVSSGGYWVDRTVWMGDPIRLLFASEKEEAARTAKKAIGGIEDQNELVSINLMTGAAAVFTVQYGGWIKNLLANILGKKCVKALAATMGQDLNLSNLERDYIDIREGLIRDAEALADRAMKNEGLTSVEPVRFPDEVMEDIEACTKLVWSSLHAKAQKLGLLNLNKRERPGPLSREEIAAIEGEISTFLNSAPENQFGTTNMKIGIVFALADLLVKAGLVPEYQAVLTPPKKGYPEGINSMRHVAQRFAPAGLPKTFTDAIKLFEPLWNS